MANLFQRMRLLIGSGHRHQMDSFRLLPSSRLYRTRYMPSSSHAAKAWKIKVPPRALAFGWLVILSKVLTMDNLKKAQFGPCKWVPTCLADAEYVDHLF